jgi:DNA polymerase elongation subunit (family B)
MDQAFRLFDFNVFNKNMEEEAGDSNSDESEDQPTSYGKKCDKTTFIIQMFGINEKGQSCSILVDDYKPFFYIKVPETWGQTKKGQLFNHIKQSVGSYYTNCIVDCKLIKRKKLYGFDAGKEYRFVMIEFSNMNAFNKVKKMWYKNSEMINGRFEQQLLPDGYAFTTEDGETAMLEIYESNIPPLLRFFHIQDISPTGWVALPNKKTIPIANISKTTTCTFEFKIEYKNIIPLNNKETRVPYKICSFDIEASSSHGDFPVPKKSYKKLATNIVDYFDKLFKTTDITTVDCKQVLQDIMLRAFGFPIRNQDVYDNIDLVYPKVRPRTEQEVLAMFNKWINQRVRNPNGDDDEEANEQVTIESMFESKNKSLYGSSVSAKLADEEQDADADAEEDGNSDSDDDAPVEDAEDASSSAKWYLQKKTAKYENRNATVFTMITDSAFDRSSKVDELNRTLCNPRNFPELEGDKVTFIGSTFLKYGDKEPYMNHCIALNTCDHVDQDNTIIESYGTEKEVLLAWRDLINQENPDVIIGYNIFGFDYTFMFQRALETECAEEFLKMSRNANEVCASTDFKTKKLKIEESSIVIASGTHELQYIKMQGRVQIDMYNYFRREENLTSYKLDYVAGHFIGDDIKQCTHIVEPASVQDTVEDTCLSKITTANMTGLLEGTYIHIEEFKHSINYYKNGAKFKVCRVNKAEGWFTIYGHETPDIAGSKSVRWCLAKDDVTPQDIFRLSNGSSADRSIVAKYCIQDCNLVQYLFNKVDVLTGFVEMAKLCSVPMSFLVFRGQGIKLLSFVAKKCREKKTLMPVINKGNINDGYEGAIVLDPKCGLYLDNPVAVGDFASLYPSSMLSENISHDSKVWTKEYDLCGNLIAETGVQNKKTGQFVYDGLEGYEYVQIKYDTYKYVRAKPTAKAQKVLSGYKVCCYAQFPEGRAIMPAILEELLSARKSTRKLIPQQDDEFMKNVLDKRQLAYKVTANSLYGQCGAKTSAFYEQDAAASTTATGRKLLTYAKRVVEECYGDNVCETAKYGQVRTKAEYIYGDTDSVFFTFNLTDMEGNKIGGEPALEISIELAKEATHLVSQFLKVPHDFEYEKTFMPFCLLSKKRYVGMLYEHNPKKGKRKEMGIVLKRRDNAPIVKDIYGGVIDIFMKEQNLQKAVDFLKQSLQDIVDEKISVDKLIISKSLNSFYKNPKQIAHKVLADRIATREPGNKPKPGDRIPFIYIVGDKKDLQGNKIETPAFIRSNPQTVKIDYSFYITNQIMKPLLQLFGLVLEQMWELKKMRGKIATFKAEVQKLRDNEDKFEDKLTKLKDKEVKGLLFDDYLRKITNVRNGNKTVTQFFALMKKNA